MIAIYEILQLILGAVFFAAVFFVVVFLAAVFLAAFFRTAFLRVAGPTRAPLAKTWGNFLKACHPGFQVRMRQTASTNCLRTRRLP